MPSPDPTLTCHGPNRRKVDAGVGAIVDTEEFAARRAIAAHMTFSASPRPLVCLAQERGYNVAGVQIEIVAGAVEIAQIEVAAVPLAIGLRQLDVGDLGGGVPLVGRFEQRS